MKNFTKKKSENTIQIGEVRFSYAYVLEPKTGPDGKQKYSVSLLLPKENTAGVKLLKEMIENIKAEYARTSGGGRVPANFKTPLRDGDTERDDDVYAGHWFINASNNNKPQVQIMEDGVASDALDQEDFYSGCYGAALITLKPYDKNGNRGITAYVNSVIKTRDGKKLSGSTGFSSADLDELASMV